ncbi:ABC-type multidrug transport system ATPase subunit [Puniceicoccus vermicola]
MSPMWTLYRHIAALTVMFERDADPIRREFESLVDEMDLREVVRKPFVQMSRGQLYKSALISMKLMDCPIWLLDEPFASGMDSHGTRVMKQWFRAAAESGKTIIFTTQLPEIAVFADRVVLLQRQKAQFFRTSGRDVLDGDGRCFDLEEMMEESRCGN